MSNQESWRDIGRSVRFFVVDGRVAVFIVILIYHPSLFTLYLFLISIAILYFLETRGYSVPNTYRYIKAWFAGPYRPAVISRRIGRSDR